MVIGSGQPHPNLSGTCLVVGPNTCSSFAHSLKRFNGSFAFFVSGPGCARVRIVWFLCLYTACACVLGICETVSEKLIAREGSAPPRGIEYLTSFGLVLWKQACGALTPGLKEEGGARVTPLVRSIQNIPRIGFPCRPMIGEFAKGGRPT